MHAVPSGNSPHGTSATQYSGWPNRETWLIWAWIQEMPGARDHWRDAAHRLTGDGEPNPLGRLAQELMLHFVTNKPDGSGWMGPYRDLLSTALGRVGWWELAQAFINQARDAREENS